MRGRDWVGKATLALAFAALLLIGFLIGARWRRRLPPPRPRLLAAFLAVGTGDCTLIRTPDGHAALIDAGPAEAGPVVARTLLRQGIRSLDLLVLAAPAAGSIGGVPGLLDNGVTVRQAWDNGVADTGEARRAARAALRVRNVPVQVAHRGDRVFLGSRGARLAVLWPPEHGARAHTDALVCRLDYGETGIVLAGPADGVEEAYLVSSAGESLSCDVLEVAAGGADSATSAELLRRATPAVAVISGAPSAPPGPGTLHRLQAAGAGIWRTDTLGAITMFSDGHGPPIVTGAHMDAHK